MEQHCPLFQAHQTQKHGSTQFNIQLRTSSAVQRGSIPRENLAPSLIAAGKNLGTETQISNKICQSVS